MLPSGALTTAADDIVCRAYFRTCSTTDTIIGHAEGLVRNNPFDEGFAQDIAVDAWPMPLVGLNDVSLSFSDERYE